MTNPEETPQEIIARYEAGAERNPDSTDDQGKLWWTLLNSSAEQRRFTLARCVEPGWVTPAAVAYLATILQLPPGEDGWDDITRKVRALMTPPEPEPEPEPGPIARSL